MGVEGGGGNVLRLFIRAALKYCFKFSELSSIFFPENHEEPDQRWNE